MDDTHEGAEGAVAKAGPVRRGGRPPKRMATDDAAVPATKYRNTAGRSHMAGASLGDIAASTNDDER